MKPFNNNHQPDQKNLIVAIVLSLTILGLFHFFYEKPRIERLKQEQAQQQELKKEAGEITSQLTAEVNGTIPSDTPVSEKPRKEIRIPIESPALSGTINLIGARIDDLTLNDYDVSLDDDQKVTLLAPSGTANPYYGQFGWLGGQNVAVPNAQSEWKIINGSKTLTPQTPVTLQWNNGQGQVFEKTIALDDNFLFTISQRVINQSGGDVVLFPYGLLTRINLPDWIVDNSFLFFKLLHEGPIGYLDGELREIDYKDLRAGRTYEIDDRDGWLGITDKYWLAALIPPAGDQFKTRFIHSTNQGRDQYQVDMRGDAVVIANGASAENVMHFFAGAKKLSVLEQYERQLGVEHLDLAIDFGWYYFMTKPFSKGLTYLGNLTGNFGIAILIFTVFIRILVYPLASKAYRSMARMKTLGPEMQAIKERSGTDKQAMQRSLMELYQREDVNPFSGCLPIIVQIPIFFALYKVLFVTIEMRHAPFFGWITDLSQRDPTSVFNLFGLLPYSVPAMLMIGALPIMMGITMYLQQRLNPPPADPIHRTMMSWFPVMITFFLAGFPAGLVIYWTWNNTLAIIQQWIIMRSMGIKVNLLKRPEEDDIVEAQKVLKEQRALKKFKKAEKAKKKK